MGTVYSWFSFFPVCNMVMKTITMVLTCVLSMQFFIGAAMLAGQFPDHVQREAWTAMWSAFFGVTLDSTMFFNCVGLCKAFGIIALWGFMGPFLETLANFLFIVLCALAWHMHVVLHEEAIPPVVMGSLFFVRLCCSFMVSPSDAKPKLN